MTGSDCFRQRGDGDKQCNGACFLVRMGRWCCQCSCAGTEIAKKGYCDGSVRFCCVFFFWCCSRSCRVAARILRGNDQHDFG